MQNYRRRKEENSENLKVKPIIKTRKQTEEQRQKLVTGKLSNCTLIFTNLL